MTELNSVDAKASTNREASLPERPCEHPKLKTCKKCGKKKTENNWHTEETSCFYYDKTEVFIQSDIDKFHADLIYKARKEMCEGRILQADEILSDLQRCLYGTKTT